MKVINITSQEKEEFNQLATHPLQSFAWGTFREKTGVQVMRIGFKENEILKEAFQITIHKIPYTPWSIGYVPKGNIPSGEVVNQLRKIGEKYKCIFIQLEPNIEDVENAKSKMRYLGLLPSAHPLFTKYSFVLNLAKSEDEILANMHPKTRYNIRIAKKHGVKIVEDNSPQAFAIYQKLVGETTTRQKFYAHSKKYRELMWEILRPKTKDQRPKTDLFAHLLLAKYQEKILAAWILFTFHDVLYYPYGASSNANKETMASNLMMWEAIRFGKNHDMKFFDMWGAMSSDPNTKDPWYGFHRFKEGYAPRHITYIGSYDLVINPLLYQGYKILNKIRWMLLRIKK